MELEEFEALPINDQIAVIVAEKKVELSRLSVLSKENKKKARLAEFDAATEVALEEVRVRRYKARLELIATLNGTAIKQGEVIEGVI